MVKIHGKMIAKCKSCPNDLQIFSDIDLDNVKNRAKNYEYWTNRF